MQQLVCIRPGQLEYTRNEKPDLSPGHAIIRITRVGICGTDLHAFEGTQPFFSYPRILGHELAGELVEADNAPAYKPGDTVTVIPYFSCGHCIACRSGKQNCCVNLKVSGIHIDGGMAEYLSVPSYSLVHGRDLPVDALALVEPLAIGAHSIGRAQVQPGEWVLVVGAGPIGLGTMAFAQLAGGKVIALDVNAQRLQFCKDTLGIAHTVNAGDADAFEQIQDITSRDMPTVIFDATGNLKAINHAFRYMAHGARYVLIGLQNGEVSFNHPEFHKREGTLMSSRNATRADFEHVLSAMRTGDVDPKTYITHRVSFDRVADEFQSWLNPAHGVIKAMVALS